MGANGKGNGKNGKRDGSGAAPEPAKAEDKPPNGKGKAGALGSPAEPPSGPGTQASGHSEAPDEPSGEAREPAEREAAAEASPRTEAPDTASPRTGSPDGAPSPSRSEPPPPSSQLAVLRGAAWAHPIARFEQRWTWLESRLLTFVLVWQILALVSWVLLNGLSESVTTGAGVTFRAVLAASAAGGAAWWATRNKADERRRDLTLGAIAVSIALVILWRRACLSGAGGPLALDRGVVKYFDNIKGWLQEGSTLTLLGGLRGLGTRLTLWLALLGGSLATASGKHIHVDVVFRFLPKSFRMPVSVLNYCFAALVCFAAVWGFVDHMAIEVYGSKADDGAGQKIEQSLHYLGNHAFFTRKQIGLDLRSLPHVLSGERYDQWMTADAWNGWIDGAGFEDRFDAASVKNLRIPEGTHPPFVVSPDGETTRGALAHTLGLVFPFGLFAIALRFLIRALLTLSGHFAADPDDAHKEEIGGGHEQAKGGV